MPNPGAAAVVEATADAAGKAQDAQDLWKLFQWARTPIRKPGMIRGGLALSAALGAIEGSAKSVKELDDGGRDRWLRNMGAGDVANPLALTGLDTLRVLGNVGNAIGYGLPEKLSDQLSRLRNL